MADLVVNPGPNPANPGVTAAYQAEARAIGVATAVLALGIFILLVGIVLRRARGRLKIARDAVVLGSFVALAGGVALLHAGTNPSRIDLSYPRDSMLVDALLGERVEFFYNGAVSSELVVATDQPTTLTITNATPNKCELAIPEWGISTAVPPKQDRILVLAQRSEGYARMTVTGDGCDVLGAHLVRVMDRDRFSEWFVGRDRQEQSHPERAEHLYESYCAECHSTDGTEKSDPARAPSFKGLYGSRIALTDGHDAVVDESFVKWAMFADRKAHDTRYPRTMPSFSGVLPETQVSYLIGFMRTKSGLDADLPVERGR
jgi:hypothetical protein